MYYRITKNLYDKMRVYKETPLDKKHPAYGVEIKEMRTPRNRDYFTVENGNIKLISGSHDKNEFNGVKISYPKDTKEIYLFIENNKSCIIPLTEETYIKDYKLTQHYNNLMADLMGIDMTIEDYRKIMDTPPTPPQKKVWNKLWYERDKIIKQLNKNEKKQNMLLSGREKNRNNNMER